MSATQTHFLMVTQQEVDHTMANINAMQVATYHQANFCGVWVTVKLGLEILRTMIPGVGPVIIGTLLALGNIMVNRQGYTAVLAGETNATSMGKGS